MTTTKATDNESEKNAAQSSTSRANSVADQVAQETEVRDQRSNGNRKSQSSGKAGGAERGGPDLDKAEDREPPDSNV